MPWLTPDAHAQAVEAAREIVLRRLDRSAAPRAALADLLERKAVDPRIAEEVLDRLEAVGVIDDAAYAARLARTRFAEKGAARRAIAEELRRKGLEESDVAAALDQIDSEDENEAALALARKKLISTRHLPWEVRRRRTAAMLGRKGYSRETTMRAIEDALDEERPPR
ncbi:regulatory protein RecX [Actinomyces viscosus]|uniref:regulatory protein RecX n=1 Tax=Actinomyces viscosus TaxID=1656 RepID=UPI0028EB2FF0|nr:regulatory protein RecX [Actinomyces viscosus]